MKNHRISKNLIKSIFFLLFKKMWWVVCWYKAIINKNDRNLQHLYIRRPRSRKDVNNKALHPGYPKSKFSNQYFRLKVSRNSNRMMGFFRKPKIREFTKTIFKIFPRVHSRIWRKQKKLLQKHKKMIKKNPSMNHRNWVSNPNSRE